ncbi:MAG: diacylglycerol kinase, partial [Treponema sp.]|nr:diacylglycerol kinase [Treponema sp.]
MSTAFPGHWRRALKLEDFAGSIDLISSRCLVAPGRPLRWTLIANPRAGGFTIGSRWKKHRRILADYAGKARANPLREGSGVFYPTSGPGDARIISSGLLAEAGKERAAGARQNSGEGIFHLIITAGGDGTSNEVLSVLYQAPEALRRRFAVLRLPMGTGNDGADAPELDRALEFLVRPVSIGLSPAVRLTTASGKGPYLAFNILSVGLDAFVTHMTNRMKGKLPGDSYKLWVDIAALFYDRIYRVGPLDVRALDGEGRETRRFKEKLLLLAVGASGRRSYGSQKKILPDDRNVCAIRQMPLLRKLFLKELFNTGGHID